MKKNNGEEGLWILGDWEDNWWSEDFEEEGERRFGSYMVGLVLYRGGRVYLLRWRGRGKRRI